MVLISEVIMVVTTMLVTLSQCAPAARRGAATKARHSSRTDHDDRHYQEPATSSSSDIAPFAGNWTGGGFDHRHISSPGTSSADAFDSARPSSSSSTHHPIRRHHHDSTSRRRHKHHHDEVEEQATTTTTTTVAPIGTDRGRYEHLCETVMRTVHLNTDTEEYNPPFYVEVRCRQPEQTHSYSSVQKCAFNLLHCVQTYSSVNFSRRKADGSDCWQPFTVDIPSGCECMWPIEEFGPLNRREDL